MRLLLAFALTAAATAAYADLHVVGDDDQLHWGIERAMQAAIATRQTTYVLAKDSQVVGLTAAPIARDVQAAQRRGVQFLVCATDLERFGVEARALPPGVRVVPQEGTVTGRYAKQLEKLCNES